MVSCGSLGAGVDFRGAAVLTDAQHGGLVEQSAFIEIENEIGERLVVDRQQVVLQPREMVGVRVPARGTEQAEGIPVDRYESAAGFDQAAGGQQRLTEQRHPVSGTDSGGFSLDVDGVSHFVGRQQGIRPTLVLVEDTYVLVSVERGAGSVELLQQ